jgi:cytoskeleton protein RodZ
LESRQSASRASTLWFCANSRIAKGGVSRIITPVMPTVAEQLRDGREAMKLDIYQVAEATKIRTDHIRALEAGDYDMFVAPVYIRGFVRTYAGLLKLDVPAVMRDLGAELGQSEKFSEPPALGKQRRGVLDLVMLQLSRIDWRILAALLILSTLVLLAVAGHRLWSHQRSADPLRKLGPPVLQDKSGSEQYLPPPAPGGK